MMAYGLYERTECRHLRRLIARGAIVFDVNANIGYMSAKFAEAVGLTGHVYAFEPSPTCEPALQAVAQSSDWQNITVVSAAVAETSRNGTYFETENIISHGFGRIDVRPSNAHRVITEHPIHIVSLNDFFEDRSLNRLEFVKIDVERAERQVIVGMACIFARGLRTKLLIEMTGADQHRQEALAVHEILTAFGYRSFRINKEIVPLPIHALSRDFHANVLWSAQERPTL
jgi:FkbM family methyltransferase